MTLQDAPMEPKRLREWHTRFPSYEKALPVESVDAKDLTETTFYREFVLPSRPVHIRGACDGWPARRQWKSLDYLRERVGSHSEVSAMTRPTVEYRRFLDKERLAEVKKLDATELRMTFGEFLDRATAPECDYLALHSYAIDLNENDRQQRARNPLRPRSYRGNASVKSLLTPLAGDIDGFSFAAGARASDVYDVYRAFIYRNSFTDWHGHAADEALMCQVVGSKEVLVMPPDEKADAIMFPIIQAYGGTCYHDVGHRFEGADLRRVVVNEGDALYIPIYWWHSVAAIDDNWGFTVAATFRSPLAVIGNLRMPPARRAVAAILQASPWALRPAIAANLVVGSKVTAAIHRAFPSTTEIIRRL